MSARKIHAIHRAASKQTDAPDLLFVHGGLLFDAAAAVIILADLEGVDHLYPKLGTPSVRCRCCAINK